MLLLGLLLNRVPGSAREAWTEREINFKQPGGYYCLRSHTPGLSETHTHTHTLTHHRTLSVSSRCKLHEPFTNTWNISVCVVINIQALV